MNRADLIDAIRDRLGADKKTAEAAVDAVLDTIQRAVATGERVAITGFGVFEKVDRAARTGRNPRTGETVKVKKTSVPKFRPGTQFKGVVSGAIKLGKVADAATKAAAKSASAARARPALRRERRRRRLPRRREGPRKGAGQEGARQAGAGEEDGREEGSGAQGAGQEGCCQEGTGQKTPLAAELSTDATWPIGAARRYTCRAMRCLGSPATSRSRQGAGRSRGPTPSSTAASAAPRRCRRRGAPTARHRADRSTAPAATCAARESTPNRGAKAADRVRRQQRRPASRASSATTAAVVPAASPEHGVEVGRCAMPAGPRTAPRPGAGRPPMRHGRARGSARCRGRPRRPVRRARTAPDARAASLVMTTTSPTAALASAALTVSHAMASARSARASSGRASRVLAMSSRLTGTSNDH